VTTVVTSDQPTAAPTTTPAPVVAAVPVATTCALVYQDHDATISFEGAGAGTWCDRVRQNDGHWFLSGPPSTTGTFDYLCSGTTDVGAFWWVRDTGSDRYGKAACVLLNQLGLRQPMEN
jgi:hypothetical protein